MKLGDRPIVSAKCGPVIGQRSGDVRIFKGIPFAEPPVGSLRFRAPLEKAPWTAPLDASAFGPAPMQAKTPMLTIAGSCSEDCLTLNVWTPVDAGPHPVLFSIFGGGNFLGSSSQPEYDGAAFAQKGIVYVSANYRLGAFGFMEMGALDPTLAGSGLNGLRDILEALRWVRDNIGAFGGDPDQVTLLGISAGAKNQCALAAMPASRGLFQRMTIMSGGGHTVYASADEAAPVALRVLQELGLGSRNAAALTYIPAAALLESQSRVLASFGHAFPFRPAVGGEELPYKPIEAAERGLTAPLDIVVGSTRDEAALALAFGAMDAAISARQLANLDVATVQAIEKNYERSLPGLTAQERHVRILTAEEYWIPCVRYAEAHARSGGRVHMYRFDWEADSGAFAGYAVHGADSPFVYGGNSYFGGPLSSEKRDAARRVHTMWAQWAKGEAPALNGTLVWPLYDEVTRWTLLLDRDPRIASDPGGEERRIWDGVF